ncbi:MAG: methyltransferase domain-containing protein [Candidatus Lokiarchaeota archaeon]|nr:methyltransferase domain-containing protein [Candidatus Lokiarchaeota archaeon]
MAEHKRYDFSVNDVSEVYAGPGGKLWELLMGEQIHVGGPEQTDILAIKAGLDRARDDFFLLDICSALGGPARHLAEVYGINVVGLDITPEMVSEAKKRTIGKPYESKIEYRIGSGLDIPAHSNSFDCVWGQDAWCYIRDKARLIEEIWRVLKPRGILAFTDWIWGPVRAPEEESDFLMEFMVFPDLQTLDGYSKVMENLGYKIVETQDLQEDFAKHMDKYAETLQKAKSDIEAGFGPELYLAAEEGVLAWQKAAHEKKVGRGLWIAKKP